MAQRYAYIYTWRPEERALCQLEQRSLFGFDVKENILLSSILVEPSRSPFIKERLEVLFEGETFQQIMDYAQTIDVPTTYKVICLNTIDIADMPKIARKQRQQIERAIGMTIHGEPSLEQPELVFGVLQLKERWYFGLHQQGKAVWLEHQQKPQTYSTSLSTRVARAIVNIATPHPAGITVIDPCCGIGTVLIEALSMGITIEGRDINPFACVGARKNIAYFGYDGKITLGPIADIDQHYNVAIVDMPYNIFTHISQQSQLDIVKEARRIADRVIFVTIEPLDEALHTAGFHIKDKGTIHKQSFVRKILVCE